MTGNLPSIGERAWQRNIHETLVLGNRTSGVEHTPLRRVQRTRHIALQDHPRPLAFNLGVGNWHSRQQRLGIRVLWVAVNSIGITLLDDLAQLHHGNGIAHMPYNR